MAFDLATSMASSKAPSMASCLAFSKVSNLASVMAFRLASYKVINWLLRSFIIIIMIINIIG